MNEQASSEEKDPYRPPNFAILRTAVTFLVFSGISFYFIYSPALNIPFAHHDQFRFFTEDFHKPISLREKRANDSANKALRQIGRPIAAELEYRTFKNVYVIKDLTLFRFIAVSMISLSATVISVWLCYLGLPKVAAFAVSGSLFTLPGIQVFVCMAANPLILAILLALFSSLLLYRFRLLSAGGSLREKLRPALLTLCMSFLTLTAALFSYPTLAYFFLLVPLTLILFRKLEDWSETRKVVVMHLGMLGSASILYFIIVKYFSPSLVKMPATYEIGLTNDIFGKMKWFTEGVSVLALNLWNIYLKDEVALAVLLLICLGVLANFLGFLNSDYFHKDKGKATTNVLHAVAGVTGLVLAANVPLIIMPGRLLLFRIILVYSAVIAVMLFFSLKGLAEGLARKRARGLTTAVFCTVFAGSAVSANFNTSNNALNSYTEILFLSSQLARHINDEVKRIHVILPISEGNRYTNGYLGLPQLTDEFNMASLSHLHCLPEKVRAALLQVMDREKFVVIGCGKDGDIEEYLRKALGERIIVTYTEAGEPVQMTPNTVVINMNDLMQISFERNRAIEDSMTLADDSAPSEFGTANAFDCSVDTFWEASGPFPHWIERDFGDRPKAIRTYALQTGPAQHPARDTLERMAKDWQFEGSNDGEKWKVLDIQKDQVNWKVGEIRAFSCPFPESFRHYRLYITDGINPDILRLYEVILSTKTREDLLAQTVGTLSKQSVEAVVDPNDPGQFTLIVLPDTQSYTLHYPHIFTSQTEWIKDNKERMNIAFVLHEGDFTENNSDIEWERAVRSMSVLDGVVPYTFCAGNHDVPNHGKAQSDARDNSKLNRYFPASRYENAPWWGGFDPSNPDGRYVFFEAGGMEFMIVSLEFGPNDAMLSWANQVVSKFRDKRTIFLTHCYMHQDDTRAGPGDEWNCRGWAGDGKDGEQLWDEFVKLHDNIFLVLSGHILGDGLGRLSSKGLNGNVVHQVLANYQDPPIPVGNGGNGWLRILVFSPRENKIKVRTYSPWLDEYATDKQNSFDLEYAMTNDISGASL